MISIKKIVFFLLVYSFTSSVFFAQIKNTKTETVKVYGNCEMCKQTIEKAGTVTNESQVVWNVKTKQATVTYDSEKTSLDKILKKIAQSGYDNEKYRTKDSAYKQLPICCQYERKK